MSLSLASWGWFFNLLDVMGSAMPFGAFGVTKDWGKSFDCFGAAALLTDHWIFVFKAVLYLVMTGLQPDACPIISDALAVCCFCIALSASALIFFVSFKSAHGVSHVFIRWIWLVLVGLVVAVGYIMYLIQEPRQSYDTTVSLISLIVMFAQLVQSVYPVLVRCGCGMGEANFVSDENTVILIKSGASLITIITALYDCWSYWTSLVKYVTFTALWLHRAMCVVGALCALVQLITRIVSVKDRIMAGFKKIKAAWDSATTTLSGAWKSTIACLSSVCECVKSCGAAVWSGCSSAINWLKDVWTG